MTSPTEGEAQLPPAKRQWWLAGFALVLSVASFFVPQRIPLEWYPLNQPGTDIHYLEIKCASNADGWVTLWYDITNGWSDIDQIRFPISPTEQTYTYTFPLPDAPLTGLRIDPVAKGGKLTVHHMRIINRRGEEVRTFPIESLTPVLHIASIEVLEPGWTITSTADGIAPRVLIEPFPPIQPVGMSGRNLHRCLLSTGYLAGMLVILMLAVTSAFWRPHGWRDFIGHVLLLVTIAIPFSTVGNRGLIRNSIRYALYEPTVPIARPTFEVTVQADRAINAQLYWDTGTGFAEPLSERRGYVRTPGAQTLRFTLPDAPLRSLRFDPDDKACAMQILNMEVTDGRSTIRATIPLESFTALNQIDSLRVVDGVLHVVCVPESEDPYLFFTPDAITAINTAASSIRDTAQTERDH